MDDNDKTEVDPRPGSDVETALGGSPGHDDVTAVGQGNDDKTEVAPGHKRLNPRATLALRALPADAVVIKDRFILEQPLGRGGMGQVYKARDLRKEEAQDDQPWVAIKFLREEFGRHPRALISLQREAKKSQQLAHPNVVTVYDFDRDGERVYMTMEYLEGEPLSRWEELKLPGERKQLVTGLIEQISRGLAFAHEHGVVHSDLKPANVFVTREGRVKILDFGIARIAGNAVVQDSFDAGELGALTAKYASLEMLEGGHEPHPADDVYALGLIAHQLYTGEHPFGGKNAVDAMAEGLSPPLIKGINRARARAIQGALAFRQADRIQSASLFLRAFSPRQARSRILLASVLLLSISSAFFAYRAMQPEGPAVPFEELPIEVQAEFLRDIDLGQKSASIQDWDGAARYFIAAYELHPRNPEAEKGLEQLAQQLVSLEGKMTSDRQRGYLLSSINAFSGNEYLANHPDLAALKGRLEAAAPR